MDLALGDLEVDVIVGDDAREALGDALELEQRNLAHRLVREELSVKRTRPPPVTPETGASARETRGLSPRAASGFPRSSGRGRSPGGAYTPPGQKSFTVTGIFTGTAIDEAARH